MRLHVLLDAYQCAPGGGSVSQIGFEWLVRLSKRARVTLLTHVRNETALAGIELEPDTRIETIDTEWFAGPLHRLATRIFPSSEHAVFALSSLDFFVYDAVCLRRARRLVRKGERFDVVHVVTPVSPSALTRMHRLGPPLVRGPLNGGLSDPTGFEDLARTEGSFASRLRVGPRLVDSWLGASRHAALTLVATGATRAVLPPSERARARTMLENGVDLERFRSTPWPAPPSATEPLRVVFVGRLVSVKALPLLLDAVALSGVNAVVRVVGEGPMRASWQAHAETLGLGPRIAFVGALPLDAVAKEIAEAHVLCLPSIRESGGSVILEAFASARPALVADSGGPGELVDDEVGRAVAAPSPDALRAGLAAALLDIVRAPQAWEARGRAARRRAEERFDWEKKIDEALGFYERLAAEKRWPT